jgi:hypothetical protein
LDIFKRIEESNMKFRLAILAFFVFFAGSTAFSAAKYYLPQVAIGSYDGGSFRTTFVFFNNHLTTSNVTLKLTNDDGTPMTVTIPDLGTNSSFTFLLGSGSTQIFQTDNSGTARAGAATITSDSEIGVSGLFTIYDKNGNFVTEAGVGNSPLLTKFVLPVQAIGNYNTGLALFNPGTAESTLTFTLVKADGTVLGTVADYKLGAGKHKGVYVNGDLFKDLSNFQGTLTVQSSVAISAMTLRQIDQLPAPLSLSYTSCPVVSATSTQKTFNLAQVVNGKSFKTTFMLFNISSSTATVNLTLADTTGSPLPVTLTGQGATPKSTFPLTIEAGKSLFLQTDGTGTDTPGTAVITSDVPIGAASIFTNVDGNGNFATEVGVQDSPALTAVTLPIDSRTPDADTGIAIFNPGTTDISVTPNFLDEDGIVTPAATAIPVKANGHYQGFFGEIFPGLGNIQGSLTISSSTPISVITMRENLSPTFSMTSLPVVEGVTPGFVLPTSGAGGTATGVIVNNITASADVPNINRKVGWGLKVTPTISGFSTTYSNLQVYAVSASGSKIFSPYTATAAMYVAPGVYTVRAAGYLTGSGATNGIWAAITSDPITVVDATSTVTLTAPAPTLYNVTGTISGIDKLSGAAASLTFISTNNVQTQYTIYCGVDTTAGGTFTQQVPAGNYTAILQASSFGSTGGGTETMGFPIGTFSVSGDTALNLVMPDFATISGTATFAGGIPQLATTLTAKDVSLPPINYLNSYYPRDSSWTKTPFAGGYDMTLIKGHTYNMSLAYSLYASTDTTVATGNVYYTPATNTVTTTGADSYSFGTVPALADLVTISGTLTNNAGAVSQATIIITSSSLTGAPNTSYRASTKTATDGTWSLKVPKGKGYKLYLSSYGTPFYVP